MPSSDEIARTENPYAPPAATIADPEADRAATTLREAPFYIVAPWKAAVLWFGTFGLYSLYWFWRHWKMHKRDKNLDIWPVPRAIFSIFFAHSLNSEIDYRIVRERRKHHWSPGGWATLYVVAVLGGRFTLRVFDTMLNAHAILAVILAMHAGSILFVYQSQRAANIACGDPAAVANRRLTLINGAWLVLGLLWWALLLFVALVPEDYTQ